ncbi:putative 3-hydroxybutyryl-CoA dehydrogenase [Tanacetum coccineum]
MTFHVSSKKKDIVIQAIVENEDVKKKLCAELDKIVKGSATCYRDAFHEPTSYHETCSDHPSRNKEDIDAKMKSGTDQSMGPSQLADFIGLDVCQSIVKVLQAGLGNIKYAPCPLLVHYVDAGRFGKM